MVGSLGANLVSGNLGYSLVMDGKLLNGITISIEQIIFYQLCVDLSSKIQCYSNKKQLV